MMFLLLGLGCNSPLLGLFHCRSDNIHFLSLVFIIDMQINKKRIKKILVTLVLIVLVSAYFTGLSYFGHQHRINHPEKIVSEKNDTSLIDGWKFHLGDSAAWALPSVNDSAWTTISTDSLPGSYKGEIAWFRLHLKADSILLNKPVALFIRHFGASEIYLDGLQIASFGKVAAEKDKEENIDPNNLPVNINLLGNAPHLIAVRYSNLHFTEYKKNEGLQSHEFELLGFSLHLTDAGYWLQEIFSIRTNLAILFSLGAFLLTLSFIHFLLFLFYRKAKENLFYSLFAFCYSMLFFFASINETSASPEIQLATGKALALFLNPLLFFTLILFVNHIYDNKFKKLRWAATGVMSVLSVVSVLTRWEKMYFISLIWFIIFTVITILFGTYRALRENRPGIRILSTGIGIFALFIFVILSVFFFSQSISFAGTGVSGIIIVFIFICILLSIPISTSIYLAYSFSHTNRSLQKKLIEVEDLSAKTISQEKEKQEILFQQKEKLEVQVAERTKEISEQKKVIEEKNKDITDSINYAKRIQDAILPSDEQVKKYLPESFVLFRPKDIVSGDFYFFSHANDRIIAAAVDCTGHGVPGAFMSMIGHDMLQNIIDERKITDTSKILDELHKQVLMALNRDITKRDSKDGMDAAILSIDIAKREVQFSGAVRPLYYFDSAGFHEVKGDRYSIAGIKEIGSAPFASATVTVTEPTTFYIFSDGFADQFGGAEGKKLMVKRFRELLVSIQDRTMQEQKNYLDTFIQEWKAGREQMDDVMVIGIKIS